MVTSRIEVMRRCRSARPHRGSLVNGGWSLPVWFKRYIVGIGRDRRRSMDVEIPWAWWGHLMRSVCDPRNVENLQSADPLHGCEIGPYLRADRTERSWCEYRADAPLDE